MIYLATELLKLKKKIKILNNATSVIQVYMKIGFNYITYTRY